MTALVIAGPTAVGKSSLALDVAEAVGAEIVSADSRQLYRGLDIGTAKPTGAERSRVRHHLLDRLDLGERTSAGQYRRWFDEVARTLTAQGCPIVVVGGSTLYVHALVRGLADLPELPRAVELELGEVASTTEGRRVLFEELAASDPEAARTLDASKSQRLVRLVGLLRVTGRPPSELWRGDQTAPVPHHLVVLDRPRHDLYVRIERRVDAMLSAGLLDEVNDLAARGRAARSTLEATIGYREVLPVLDGHTALETAVALIKRNSRRYAKRQLTWYRRYPEAHWLDARTTSTQDVLDAVAPWPEPATARVGHDRQHEGAPPEDENPKGTG